MRKTIDLKTREGRNLFYQSTEWITMRRVVLTEQPFCIECLREGITKVSEEVDHIIDIKDSLERCFEKDNLQGLCKSCHSRKTFKGHRSFQKQTFSVLNKKWKL